MGRGGGHVGGGGHHGGGGSHHSSHTTVHVSGGGGGKANPVVSAIVMVFFGVIFLLLAIVVPVYMAAHPDKYFCHPAESVNKGEQIYCDPAQHGEDYYAEAKYTNGNKPDNWIKVYRTTTSQLSGYINRTVTYTGYSAALSEWYDDFMISVSSGVTAEITFYCTGRKCSKVKMYWMTDKQYLSATDSEGDFYEPSSYIKKDLEECTEIGPCSKTLYADGNDYRHLIFSNRKEKEATIHYDITLNYQVHDVTGLTPLSCKADCEFESVTDKDILILDYPNAAGAPDYFTASVYTGDVNWSTVLACGLIFGLIALACFGVAILYGYKALKKLGKIGKKVAKKIEKEREKEAQAEMQATAAPTVVATPVAPAPGQPGYVDPNYGQQPYPGQPVAQPGYVDPNYGQPAYPGQPM